MDGKEYVIDREITTAIEQAEFVHSLIQEIEDRGIELPMGDYALIYDYIEGIRNILMEYEDALEDEME